jgi:putative protease
MSAKDLCCLPFIEKLKKAGVKAFKIEGRNREPEYVDTAVKVYRKAIDKKLTEKEIQEGIEELKKVYNKGFSSGFFLGVPTNDGFSKIQDSASTEKKIFIGRVTHYFPNINVAAIRIYTGKIKLGDELIIIGNKTGIVRHRVERIEINKKPVKFGRKGQEIGIKIPNAKVREKDDVYVVVKR